MNIRKLHLPMIMLCLPGLSGCAAVALTAGAMAVGYSIDHVLNGIVYRTFTAPVPEVRVATLNTLDRMEIEVVKDVETESGWHIGATAAGRQVGIDLEELTPAVTRMRVVVDQDALLKDSATASEIVTQTADALDQQLALSRR